MEGQAALNPGAIGEQIRVGSLVERVAPWLVLSCLQVVGVCGLLWLCMSGHLSDVAGLSSGCR